MGTLGRLAVSIGAASLFAGCGGAQGAMPQIRALSARTDSSHYKVLYGFGNQPDGNAPVASLIEVNGTLYGTTSQGGTHSCNASGGNLCGTVFSVTTAGSNKC